MCAGFSALLCEPMDDNDKGCADKGHAAAMPAVVMLKFLNAAWRAAAQETDTGANCCIW